MKRIKKIRKSKVFTRTLILLQLLGLINYGIKLRNMNVVYEQGSLNLSFDDNSILEMISRHEEFFKKYDNLTRDVISFIKELSLDPTKDDFKDIKKIPNLETIYIENFDELTDKDKKIINKSSVKNIKLPIRKEYLKGDKALDLSWVGEDKRVVLLHEQYYLSLECDFEDLIMYRYYMVLKSEYDCEITCPKIDKNIDDWEAYDKQICGLISSYNLDGETKNEKLIKLIDYVVNYLEYDPIVSKRKMFDDFISMYYYNINPLDKALNSKNHYGICVNYAALTYLLGQYLDLPIDISLGNYNGSGHAWCTYNVKGEEFIVDPTSMDGRRNPKNYIRKSIENNDVKKNKRAVDYILLEKTDKYESYNEDLSYKVRVKRQATYLRDFTFILLFLGIPVKVFSYVKDLCQKDENVDSDDETRRLTR